MEYENGFVKSETIGFRQMNMAGKEQIRWQDLSKNSDLERLMREFGCTNDDVAEYPINDAEARHRIGMLISAAVWAVCGPTRVAKTK